MTAPGRAVLSGETGATMRMPRNNPTSSRIPSALRPLMLVRLMFWDERLVMCATPQPPPKKIAAARATANATPTKCLST